MKNQKEKISRKKGKHYEKKVQIKQVPVKRKKKKKKRTRRRRIQRTVRKRKGKTKKKGKKRGKKKREVMNDEWGHESFGKYKSYEIYIWWMSTCTYKANSS